MAPREISSRARPDESRDRSRDYKRTTGFRDQYDFRVGDRHDYRTSRRDRPPDDAPLGTSTIWIGGCEADLEENEMERVCSRYGRVYSIVKRSSDRDTFFFVEYGNEYDAQDAIRLLDRTQPFGTGLIMVAASKRGSSANWKSQGHDYDQGGRGDCCLRDRAYARLRDRKSDPGEGRFNRERKDDQACRNDFGRSGNRNLENRVHQNRMPDRRRESCTHYQDRRRIQSASPPPDRSKLQQSVKVYVSQLPRDMDVEEFLEVASQFGQVLSHSLERQGTYKFGFAEYASKDEARAAIQELDDREMQGWHLRLQAYLYPTC